MDDKFAYNDNVEGFIDGFSMAKGYVVDIDPESEFKYMVRCTDGEWHVFTEDELKPWDGVS